MAALGKFDIHQFVMMEGAARQLCALVFFQTPPINLQPNYPLSKDKIYILIWQTIHNVNRLYLIVDIHACSLSVVLFLSLFSRFVSLFFNLSLTLFPFSFSLKNRK